MLDSILDMNLGVLGENYVGDSLLLYITLLGLRQSHLILLESALYCCSGLHPCLMRKRTFCFEYFTSLNLCQYVHNSQ